MEIRSGTSVLTPIQTTRWKFLPRYRIAMLSAFRSRGSARIAAISWPDPLPASAACRFSLLRLDDCGPRGKCKWHTLIGLPLSNRSRRLPLKDAWLCATVERDNVVFEKVIAIIHHTGREECDLVVNQSLESHRLGAQIKSPKKLLVLGPLNFIDTELINPGIEIFDLYIWTVKILKLWIPGRLGIFSRLCDLSFIAHSCGGV